MFHLIHSQLPFIVVLLIVLLGAKVLGEIMDRFGQPSMIGKVLAGVFIGFLMLVYKIIRLIKPQMSSLHPKFVAFLHILRGKQSLVALVIVYVLAFASISESLGLQFIIGAFFGAISTPFLLSWGFSWIDRNGIIPQKNITS